MTSTDPTNKTAQNPSLPHLLTDPASQISTPTLNPTTPTTHKLRSHALLLFLVAGAVLFLYTIGFTLFQVDSSRSWTELAAVLGVAGAVILGGLWQTGFADVDLWTLVRVYGWYTLPVVGGVFVLFAMMQESADGNVEV